MNATPQASVVMSVYNGAPGLRATLDSVLGQQGCDFELVVVNDGSVDESPAILEGYAAADSRVRIIHQENAGLTRALIRGCASARGEFIVRQDADDLSLPGRLREQCAFLAAHPEVVAVASAIRFVAPGGEWLYDMQPPEVIDPLLDADSIRLPPMVVTAFRRDAYLKAGGFRETFTVAQDVDMWLRLLELGPCRGLPEAHYQARMTEDGITSRRRDEQVRLCRLAIECARERRAGRSDAVLLRSFVATPTHKRRGRTRTRAAFLYFIGSVLREREPAAAQRYFRMALRDNPLHLKAFMRSLFG